MSGQFIIPEKIAVGENLSNSVNLHVVSNIRDLICMAAFLKDKEKGYTEAAKEFNVEEAPEFLWQGYKVADWLEDISMRITKIQITKKRQKLEAMEEKLNKLVSPETRAALELEAMSKELGL